MTGHDTALAHELDAVTVQDFYAQQMQLLDAGRTEEWAATFTPDGVFEANAHPEPYVGRAAIEAGATAARAALVERGVQRRHWLGMVAVLDHEPLGGVRAVRARSYALILETPLGGPTTVLMSTTCEDVLVGDGGTWLVAERHVRRDDLAPADTLG